MTDVATGQIVAPSRDLSRRAAVVGVGNSDYAADYQAWRQRDQSYVPPTDLDLARVAFERALDEAGLDRSDIDGIGGSMMYGGTVDELTEHLGLQPSRVAQVGVGGIMAGVIPPAVAALVEGRCDTVALVYAANSRAGGRRYGGGTYVGDGRDSYYYYHPWGWSSQAAHWALCFQYYMSEFGVTEADLAAIPMTLRAAAQLNDNAIMRDPLTLEAYLGSRYIVRPLHIFDMCLVNDGAVCLLLRRTEMAADMPHAPVLVSGWAHSEVHENKMDILVRQRLRPILEEAGRAAFDMAGMSVSDIGHFQAYDAGSFHLVNQLEGYGFVPRGETLGRFADGEMSLTGRLPVNTSGGMLSEAYMHGWNHVAEAVRQLRHEAGARQIPGLETSFYALTTTESTYPLIFERGA